MSVAIGVPGDQWADVLRGAALGVAVAAPIGPTALLRIQRTLACGRLEGLATGYGAATTHTAYAAAAAAGLTAVADTAVGWQGPLQLRCGVFLLRMAVRTVRRRPVLPGTPAPRLRPWRAYATGPAWTLGNPMTLLGSASWWTALTVLVGAARKRLSGRGLRLANLATGTALALVALVVLARAVELTRADVVAGELAAHPGRDGGTRSGPLGAADPASPHPFG